MMSRLAWACIAIAGALPAPALDPSLRVSQYHRQYWQVEQGLPHSYVYSIRTGPDGFLLIATAEGLARFDGLAFRMVQADDDARLPHRWISSLLATQGETLWVGTFDGGIFELARGRIRSKHSAGASVFDLIEDTDGSIWASTREGVFHLRGGKLAREQGLGPPLDTSWNVFSLDASGTLWVLTRDGLFQRRNGRFVRRACTGPKGGEILTARRTRDGALWIGTTKGLYRVAEVETAIPGVAAPIVALLEDRDGVMWAGSWGKGLYRVHRGRAERWSTAQDLPDDFIRTLAEDQEGNLWIGMRSGGLGRWREPLLVPYGAPEGMIGDYASVVAPGPGGSLWLGTWRGGLYRLGQGALQSQPLPLPALYFTARSLAFDPQGHLWIGNWEGLFEYDGHTWRRFGVENESAIRRVSAILFDRSGALWLGSADQGLFRFPEGRPAAPPPEAMLQGMEITALSESSRGDVWAGTAEGLWRIARKDGQLQMAPVFSSVRVHSITEDTRGRIWAAASGALLVITPTKVLVLDERHGLPKHSFYRILEDPGRGFWVSSQHGLLEITADSVEQVMSGISQRLAVVPYGREDGMRTVVCHGLSQPAGARAPDGSLWFPTDRGFIQVRTTSRRRQPAPRAVVEDVWADGAPLAMSGEPLLRAGARNIMIRFTALRFSTAGKVLFRYRLAGADQDWLEAGTERSARYNELPPGNHLFEVQARDPWGEWGEPASLLLRQQPRFSQTGWFLLLAGLTGASIVFSLYRWRLRAVRSRYAAILEERNRIGREWHDTLVAGLSAISLQIEAALSAIASRPERAADILQTTRSMVHHYRAEARRVILDLRDSRPLGETLASALEIALQRVVEPRGIRGAVAVDGQPVDLPPELHHNVLRICQEAVANAVNHANPRVVDVRLVFRPGSLRAIVQDDGHGFDRDCPQGERFNHFGITIMQERARRCGGSLRIDSSPGRGTTVEAVIPLPPSSK